MSMRHYVTLFDSHYLIKGLALYDSLCRCTRDFVLHIIAFDSECYTKLKSSNLEHADIISLEEFEDEELLSVKSSRSPGEYCWTSTAKSILYVFSRTNCRDCTYLDSDLYFFGDPEELFREIPEDRSVLITEHRYTEEYDQTEISGKYCVQFMYFKNDADGNSVLNWWKDRCLEWCYAIPEDGKLGDQKYLDDWMDRFAGCVHELKNLGGGIAPWNVQQYGFEKKDENSVYYSHNTGDSRKIIFYHFHQFEFFTQDIIRLCSGYYRIPTSAVSYVYKPYIRECDFLCQKYELMDKPGVWKNESTYRSDIEKLDYSKNFFRHSFFEE